MRERPINLRGWEVRAWLDGRLSQIRRPVKPKPTHFKPGDVLWGREAWAVHHAADHLRAIEMREAPSAIYYPATQDVGGLMVRQATHMPLWASRIRWRVKAARVERVQDMINADATASGVHSDPGVWPICTPRQWYSVLWARHYGAGSWDANPWVWVLEIEGA